MYENSIKVPFIVSWPGHLDEGRSADAMVSAYDVFPTLLEYLGLPLPEGRNLPGTSFLPVLQGASASHNDKVVIFDEYGPVRMIRTEEWKYVHRYPQLEVVSPSNHDGPNDLFHLTEDPDERSNLADDPTHNAVKADLKAEMEAWFARYVTPEHDGFKEPPE